MFAAELLSAASIRYCMRRPEGPAAGRLGKGHDVKISWWVYLHQAGVEQ